MPEFAEIAKLGHTRAELEGQSRDARIVVDDLTVEQKKIDSDVEQVKARRVRDRNRMDQGLVNNPKDLERMQHELVSLERRITALEDEELEVMERLETAQAEVSSLQAKLAAIQDQGAGLTRSRDEKAAAIRDQSAS
ncbi:MAG: zinc ribbon domain-containing protein, partial [Nocardioides sp.]